MGHANWGSFRAKLFTIVSVLLIVFTQYLLSAPLTASSYVSSPNLDVTCADARLAPFGYDTMDARIFKNKPLVIVVYASHFNEMSCRTFRSMLYQGLTVFVVGHLQSMDKNQKPFKFLEVSRKAQLLNNNQVIGFLDGFDILAQRDETYIYDEFTKMQSDVVYSAEKNCWPYGMTAEAEAKLCPRYPPVLAGLYSPGPDVRWPNSGIMFCKAKACLQFFEDSIAATPEWYPLEDQARAHETCLLHGNRCKLDLYSRIAQSMLLADEVVDVGNHFYNNITRTTPAFLHFNGDKQRFTPSDRLEHLKTEELDSTWIYFENGTSCLLKDVCAEHLDKRTSGTTEQ